MKKQNLADYWTKSGMITDDRVVAAFNAVKREHFILPEYKSDVYGDYPLPIGYDQTISQPTTVMIMTQALEVKNRNRVLEVGCGSGYQAAILSKLAGKVISTERISELVEFARNNFNKAKIKNVDVIETDGSCGYPKNAPYDRIVVTAACPKIPPPLIEQLKEGGIIIAPVESDFAQEMIKSVKHKGKLRRKSLGSFRFVPLLGKYGY